MSAVLQEVKEVKKPQPVLQTDRFGDAEQKAHFFIVDVEVGNTLEQVMDPAYWAHVAVNMDPFDHIEARWEDGSQIAHLVVYACERHYAKVVLDRLIKIEANAARGEPAAKHKVEWKGPHHKHVVIRTADSKVVQSGFKTRFDAETWMRNHEKGMEK